MITIDARHHGDTRRGLWRVGWVALVRGSEIQGVKFATREEAIAYARRVAEYQSQGAAIIREVAPHNRNRKGSR